MNCGSCANWDLRDSPLRKYGHGRCKVEPNPAMRAGRTFAAQHVCTINRFAKADIKVIARREREGQAIL